MNILMMTNTYKPILGGLEKSVESFSEEYRCRGHCVFIAAPEYEDTKPDPYVIRVPALQKFNGSDFSVQLPIPGVLEEALGSFRPDIVHAHHPFLIGDTALRVAFKYNVPLVFTHHTLYEQNVHYVPGNEHALQKFVIELSTGYANLADQVFAPSQSVEQLIRDRGVQSPIEVIPTGIGIDQFSRGEGQAFRQKHNIPPQAFVVGYLGRLAPEKNLGFLTGAVADFLKNNENTFFLVAGQGPYEEIIKRDFFSRGVGDRLRLVGPMQGKDKADVYHAMDVFAFASQSETQGLVLTEALASQVPVVAVDASGVREVVEDRINGRLVMRQDKDEFISALSWVRDLAGPFREQMAGACLQTAKNFSMEKCTTKALEAYASLAVRHGFIRRGSEDSAWSQTVRLIKAEGGLVKNLTRAAGALVSGTLKGGVV